MKPDQNKIYNMFLKDTNVDRMQKILSKYELFKKIINVPGDICECGVFKGSGIYTWVKFLKLFKPNNNFKVVGFDFFGKKVKTKSKYKLDKKVLKWHETGTTTQGEIIKKCKEWDFKNLKLYAGDVKKTTKIYADENFGSRIALLYLDVDNYEGTLEILNNLYKKMAKGGIIAFDEYALQGHGESDAVDEFFKDKKIKLKSFSWANSPTAYTVIE
jgi:hypothetical protein|tara:strand:+ start:270 stop:914 length:645 start_codon:yes stop_codon:yes gene_type:complete